MENEQKICQSCGMPMTSDQDFGTNTDGSKNEEYCIHCFENGTFTLPDISLEQMIDHLVELSETWGMPKEEARKMAEENLPKLKRWQVK